MSNNLHNLIEAVEAGDLSATNSSLGVMYSGLGNHWPWDWISKVNSAFRGSLDAATSLCEELLPGWIWGRQINGAVWVAKRPHTVRAPAHMPPARALLLAVLRAKLVEMGNEH